MTITFTVADQARLDGLTKCVAAYSELLRRYRLEEKSLTFLRHSSIGEEGGATISYRPVTGPGGGTEIGWWISTTITSTHTAYAVVGDQKSVMNARSADAPAAHAEAREAVRVLRRYVNNSAEYFRLREQKRAALAGLETLEEQV